MVKRIMETLNLLSQIVQPTDLHKLSDKELLQVADELRQAILQRVSQTGGHFSSNLGTVELTVAMYAAYSLPPDKVVWDTGHQAYPHKMLTGRLNQFDTLRKHKGMSGFLKRTESEHDAFGAGHAGTAISAALGFAVARDRLGTKEKVVAVTGDASICAGMSWEALNHAGELKTDLTVVLNDNRMSIAPNVGALTSYFTRLRSRPLIQDIAHRAKDVAEKMPSPVTKVAKGLRHSITHYFAPDETGTIFEEMGFEYIGPVDGHDLISLLEIFRNVREVPGPVFVHALTVKGKGYQVAEDDARKWHGVVPFDVEAAEMAKSAGPITYTQAFGEVALECAQEDPEVVAITAAMPDGTGLTQFSKEFPDRYYDTGIAEQHAVTFAAGLAAGGIKPFCAIYSTFLQRGYDQVLHDVAIQNLPVRFFLDRAGLVGDDGPTHHGTFDLSYLTHIPNLVVAAPRDTTELKEMTRFARGYDTHPIAIRYPRGVGDATLPEARSTIQEGKGEILAQSDQASVTLVAIGSMVSVAWDVRRKLLEQGIEANVINARFAKPIDLELIESEARRVPYVMTLEENVITGGFGQQVLAGLSTRGIPDLDVEIVAIPDAFIEHGAQPLIRADAGIDADTITQKILRKLAPQNAISRT